MAQQRWTLASWTRRSRGTAGLFLSPARLLLARLADRDGRSMIADWVDHALPKPEAAADVLADAVRKLGLRKFQCTLTLGFGSYNLIQVEKPNVPDAELLAAARWKIRDNLGFPLDDAIVDAFEVPGLESRGRPPSLLAVAARRDELKRRVDAIKSAGMKALRINIGEMALRNLASRVVEDNESVAVLLLGGAIGCLVVVREKTVFVSRKLELDAADSRALAAGDEGESARERLFERIALEVQRTLDYFDSTFQRAPVRKLLVVPESTGLELLPAALRSMLGVEAMPADLNRALGVDVDSFGNTAALALAGAGAFDEERL